MPQLGMNTRHIVLFDIDGTLTATSAVDDECYCEAIAAELCVDVADVEWSGAPHVTDTGIAHWLWQRHRNRPPAPDELSAVRKRFVALLKAKLASSPHRFRAVPGAVDAIDRLRADGWAIAIATGGWGESARLKLRAADVSAANIPLACADDADAREEILMLALNRCLPIAVSPLDRIVSVGDAEWDVAAARRLSVPFVGIAAGARAERLKSAGASHVLADLEFDVLNDALRSAKVPGSPSTLLRHNDALKPTAPPRSLVA